MDAWGPPRPPCPLLRIGQFRCEVHKMNKLLLKLAIMAAAGSLLSSNPMVAQVSPTTPKAASVRITQGPELELAKEYLTIIRWTTNNPGGRPTISASCIMERIAIT